MKENEVINDLELIKSKEKEVYEAISLSIHHIAKTYDDKYKVDDNTPINTKKMLYSEEGKNINIYQVARYMQRYLTTGQMKSYLINDVYKMIHYLIFEITRRIKSKEIENIEQKV